MQIYYFYVSWQLPVCSYNVISLWSRNGLLSIEFSAFFVDVETELVYTIMCRVSHIWYVVCDVRGRRLIVCKNRNGLCGIP